MNKKLLIVGAALLALITLLLGVAAALIYPTLPDLAELNDYQPKQSLRVFTSDEVLIGEFGTERRKYLPLDQIPKQMQDALLAIEDSNFYEHSGIYLPGILRAIVANTTQGRSQGASTITQQLARTLYLTKKKVYSRKFVEALLAMKLESELSKQKILEVYMNQIYLGQRAYGFEAAAGAYYGKTLKDLSIAETAMLAGLPQNPAYANPAVNPERARRRQHLVINRMVDTGVITAEQAEIAKAEKLHIRSPQDARVHAEFAAEMARDVVFEQYGEEAYTKGLRVYTTLVSQEQAAAYRALRRSLLELEKRKPYRGPEGFVALPEDEGERDTAITQALAEHPDQDDLRAAVLLQTSAQKVRAVMQSGEELTLSGEALRGVQSALSDKAREASRLRPGAIVRVMRGAPSKAEPQGAWSIVQPPEAEGALVALEPGTGRVHALVGGFDFNRKQYNHATQAKRQPGSSFKPIVYSAALEQGVSPGTVVPDEPLVFGDWEPKNSDGKFDGLMSVRQALARSKNMVTIRITQLIGPARVREWASRFGIEIDAGRENLTLALGTSEVTPLQMASAYAVFANGGYRLPPVIIQRITDSKGQVLFEAPKAQLSEDQRAISERNAFVTASLLQEVTRSGTAARAQGTLRRPDLYGKTGTTNDAVDAWFAGFQPSLATVVWIGYDQPRSLGDRESGGGLALPVWIDFMSVALRNKPVQEIAPPAEGLLRGANGDWSFEEFAGEAGIRAIGHDGTASLSPPSAASEAASAPLP
ncbi:PBP1A family penicillin-binding protein [Paucibacter sp. DJ1R-11]|uniref:penicillin-binding protein 1A n=1 Tax=Paucibacter sp. DJ1R-11 TaxID=2893556 RepID=UPI0021E5139A|nr:PBP1A family penicillin-binding protein [Paucibacter sp. DJ1R-11]MCV2365599.1 PBP1A family penicillin-binding protein [Paucibacter sp. DJ1R-11]